MKLAPIELSIMREVIEHGPLPMREIAYRIKYVTHSNLESIFRPVLNRLVTVGALRERRKTGRIYEVKR